MCKLTAVCHDRRIQAGSQGLQCQAGHVAGVAYRKAQLQPVHARRKVKVGAKMETSYMECLLLPRTVLAHDKPESTLQMNM